MKDRDAALAIALRLVPHWHADEYLTSRVELREQIADAILEAKAEAVESVITACPNADHSLKARASQYRAQKSTAIREGK